MSELNTENTITVETEVEDSTKKVPSNIYQVFRNEHLVTQQISEQLNVFKTGKLLSTIKEKINPLHFQLKKKSKVFIFGAGGTTSWFLPKLLKIYNDAFNKVPGLRYDLEIVLIDQDQVII